MDFDTAFSRLVDNRHEGQTLDLDASDSGNWTGGQVGLGQLKGSRFGISAAQYPNLDIASLTIDQSKAIYLRDFWGPAACDAVPDAIKFDLFDMAVNSGLGHAIKTLQIAVGEVPDGIPGPLTLQAAQSLPPLRLVARFGGARLNFLTDAPGWPIEGRGWARRIAANLLAA